MRLRCTRRETGREERTLMQRELVEEIEREIVRLRRRYAAAAREWPGAQEAITRWVAEVAGLCWFVPLEDVVESDIDVEILSEVVIVRANRTWPEPAVLVGILPVPHGFDSGRVVIRFTEQTLEVHVRRVHHGVRP